MVTLCHRIFKNMFVVHPLMISVENSPRSSDIYTLLGPLCLKPCPKTLIFSCSSSFDIIQPWDGSRYNFKNLYIFQLDWQPSRCSYLSIRICSLFSISPQISLGCQRFLLQSPHVFSLSIAGLNLNISTSRFHFRDLVSLDKL